MSDNNSAVLKIIAQHTKEYNELLIQHNALMVVHTKTVNEFADKSLECGELKRKNKQLVRIVVQWEKENAILEESLDACQREIGELRQWLDMAKQEVERLNDKWELVIKRDLG